MIAERVLVVGGGLAGLSVGIALTRAGCHVEVVEKAVQWAEVGAGMYLPGNAHRAMEALGVGSRVRDKSFLIRNQVFRDHRGRTLTEVDLGEYWSGVGPCLAITRADLHHAIGQALEGADLRLGVEVGSISQLEDSVRVELSDGSSGDYQLLVGADGIHSSIRRLSGMGTAPRAVGQVSWRFIADGFVEINEWAVMIGGHRSLLAVPLPEGRVYCYLDIASASGEDPTQGNLDRLAELFDDFAPPSSDLIRAGIETGTVHFGPIEEVVIDDWVNGRIVLVGDAAHATSPNMAQGAAMAFEDAQVLGESLTLHGTVEQALASYVGRRLPRIRWVQEQTRRRDRIRYMPASVRNFSLRVAGRRIYRSNYDPLTAMW